MKFFGGNDPASRKISTLKEIPIFQPLSRNEILEVDELLHERTYEKDEIILEEGDAGHGVFIVLSGKVRVKSRVQSRGRVFECGAACWHGVLTAPSKSVRAREPGRG